MNKVVIFLLFFLGHYSVALSPTFIKKNGAIHSSKELSAVYSDLHNRFVESQTTGIDVFGFINSIQQVNSSKLVFLDDFYDINSQYLNLLIIDTSNEIAFKATVLGLEKIYLFEKLCSQKKPLCKNKTSLSSFIKKNEKTGSLSIDPVLKEILSKVVKETPYYIVTNTPSTNNFYKKESRGFYFSVFEGSTTLANIEVRLGLSESGRFNFYVMSAIRNSSENKATSSIPLITYGSFPTTNLIAVEDIGGINE